MHHDLRSELTRLGLKQHGLIALRQLHHADISDDSVRWVIRDGQLLRFRYGVMRVPWVPVSDIQPIMAACLAGGDDAVASHWAAGGLHRLRGVAPGTLEITSPRRVALAGVTAHHLPGGLDPSDRTRCESVPVTSVPRTLIDLAGTGHLWLVERALDDALVRGLCTLSDVADAMERARRRPGVAGMRQLLAARREQRVDSHQELRFVRAISRALGFDPVLHHKVVVGARVLEIDIALLPAKVGFEVNGWQAHGSRSAFDHDAKKGLLLLQEGWHVGTLTSAMSDEEVATAARDLATRYGGFRTARVAR